MRPAFSLALCTTHRPEQVLEDPAVAIRRSGSGVALPLRGASSIEAKGRPGIADHDRTVRFRPPQALAVRGGLDRGS